MTKGIRAFTNAVFADTLPQLAELGNAGFRRKVIEATVAQFGISIASAATHYNHAFKVIKEADPELVTGLGRPEDKKGGRPVLHAVTVINTRSGKVVAEGISGAKAQDVITKGGTLKSGDLRYSIKVEPQAEPAAEAAAEAAA
jgi:hypothetical protein